MTTSVRVDAPGEGRPKTRINWLLRQLKNAPDDLRIDVNFRNARETSSRLLSEARDAPERLLLGTDPTREPHAFELALTRRMGTKRGKEEGSFVRETRRQAIDFYGGLVQDLKAWQAPAPKLPPEEAREEPEEAQPEPPPFSDAPPERDPGEGRTSPPSAPVGWTRRVLRKHSRSDHSEDRENPPPLRSPDGRAGALGGRVEASIGAGASANVRGVASAS